MQFFIVLQFPFLQLRFQHTSDSSYALFLALRFTYFHSTARSFHATLYVGEKQMCNLGCFLSDLKFESPQWTHFSAAPALIRSLISLLRRIKLSTLVFKIQLALVQPPWGYTRFSLRLMGRCSNLSSSDLCCSSKCNKLLWYSLVRFLCILNTTANLNQIDKEFRSSLQDCRGP